MGVVREAFAAVAVAVEKVSFLGLVDVGFIGGEKFLLLFLVGWDEVLRLLIDTVEIGVLGAEGDNVAEDSA